MRYGVKGDAEKRCAASVCGTRVVVESYPPDRAAINERFVVDGDRPPLVCRMVSLGEGGEGAYGGGGGCGR